MKPVSAGRFSAPLGWGIFNRTLYSGFGMPSCFVRVTAAEEDEAEEVVDSDEGED